jgi:hypothetical protein
MDPDDHLRRLAIGINGYSLALTILGSLREQGTEVPFALDGRIGNELRDLGREWWTTTHGEPIFTTENLHASVRESRAWLIEHGYDPESPPTRREQEENDE